MTAGVSDDLLTAALGAEEIGLLREGLQAVFVKSGDTDSLAAALVDLGWDDVVAQVPEAVALLFEEQGYGGAASGLLDAVVLTAAGLGDLPGAAIVYPLPGPGGLFDPAAGTADGRLDFAGVARANGSGSIPETLIVPVVADRQTTLVRIAGSALTPRPIGGLDPDGGWLEVTGTVPLDQSATLAVSPEGWVTAVAAGRRALSAELLGIARRALEVAVQTVTARHQFGRAVGSFQAVRFRLADAKVAIESAADLLRLAFRDTDPLAAATAKALAGAAADTTLRQAMQVCGAMGLTWEFPLHHGYRRATALDGLLGDTDNLTTAIGRYIGTGPTLPQLEPFGKGNGCRATHAPNSGSGSPKCPAPTPATPTNRPGGR